jgi:hypothetical protein
MESTLRNAYVGQGDGAAEHVGEVAGALQTEHALGIGPVR